MTGADIFEALVGREVSFSFSFFITQSLQIITDTFMGTLSRLLSFVFPFFYKEELPCIDSSL